MKGEPAHTVRRDVLLSTHRPSSQVEKALGVEGDAILYVGDHIYTDAALAKLNFKWVRSLCCAVFCLLRRAVREWGTTYTITNAALAMLTFLPSSPPCSQVADGAHPPTALPLSPPTVTTPSPLTHLLPPTFLLSGGGLR